MAELKPKQDNEMARDELKRDAEANMPRPSKETKPHGDKLAGTFKGASPTRH